MQSVHPYKSIMVMRNVLKIGLQVLFPVGEGAQYEVPNFGVRYMVNVDIDL